MATCSSILAWRIPWRLQRVGNDWAMNTFTFTSLWCVNVFYNLPQGMQQSKLRFKAIFWVEASQDISVESEQASKGKGNILVSGTTRSGGHRATQGSLINSSQIETYVVGRRDGRERFKFMHRVLFYWYFYKFKITAGKVQDKMPLALVIANFKSQRPLHNWHKKLSYIGWSVLASSELSVKLNLTSYLWLFRMK